MRGYGGTTAPKTVEQYNIYALAGDSISLLTFLGYDQAILVGHDWGADYVWKLASLFPNTFPAVCAMSVPYTGRVQPLLSILKKVYGDPFDKEVHSCSLLLYTGDPLPRSVKSKILLHATPQPS